MAGARRGDGPPRRPLEDHHNGGGRHGSGAGGGARILEGVSDGSPLPVPRRGPGPHRDRQDGFRGAERMPRGSRRRLQDRARPASGRTPLRCGEGHCEIRQVPVLQLQQQGLCRMGPRRRLPRHGQVPGCERGPGVQGRHGLRPEDAGHPGGREVRGDHRVRQARGGR